jgi:hypothetical protein
MLSKFFNMFKLKPKVVPEKSAVVERDEKAESVHQAMTAPYVCEPSKPIVTIEAMDEPKFVHAKVDVVEPEPVVEEKPKSKPAAKKPSAKKSSTKKATKSTK